MSIQAVAAAIELRGIPTTPKLILMLLANAHNKHSEKCFPDQQRLADEASVDVKTVARHLKWLEDEGYIHRQTTHLGRGKGSETHFELRFLQRTFCPVQEDRPLTGEIKTPQIREIDPSQTRGENKKPESQPESQTGNMSVGAAVKSIWEATPKSSRTRSSQKLLKTQIEKLMKQVSGERLLAGWEKYLADPKTQRDDFEFVPGVHRWFRDRKHEEWMPPEQDLLSGANDDAPGSAPWAEDLEFSFRMLNQLGEWIGWRYDFPLDPRDPAADYPAALYEKYSIERRAA